MITNVRALLVSLAVFVEQARLDEERHVHDQRHSLRDDIRHLEEEGIYNILCALQACYLHFSQVSSCLLIWCIFWSKVV